MSRGFAQAAAQIAAASRDLHARGWVPATSGNFSVRIGGERIAITASGRDKSKLSADDVIEVDLQGRATNDARPSAETGLHLQLYRRDPGIGAILHTHSLNAMRISMRAGSCLEFTGLELLKAFPGIDSHEYSLGIPIFANDQDIVALASRVEQHMDQTGQGHAYLIRGHGLYTWASDLQACLMHLEALEHLLDYYWSMHPVPGHE